AKFSQKRLLLQPLPLALGQKRRLHLRTKPIAGQLQQSAVCIRELSRGGSTQREDTAGTAAATHRQVEFAVSRIGPLLLPHVRQWDTGDLTARWEKQFGAQATDLSGINFEVGVEEKENELVKRQRP